MEKIAMYGGSFNPIHNAHIAFAENLLDKGYLDKIVFVPNGNGYVYKSLLEEKHRLEMVKLAISSNDNLEVSSYEFDDVKYTYQTLDYLQSINKDDTIYLIMGSDNFKWLDEWKRYEYILENYKIIVVLRESQTVTEELIKYRKYSSNITVVEDFSSPISSTIIRDKIYNGLYDEVNKLIPDKVFNYITANSLYI